MENTKVGPFQILEKLGNVRRQRVYRAIQVEQNAEVALKFIKIPPKFDRGLALEKLNYEFSILKTLRHPNLVRIYGAGCEGDNIFLASELVAGESLTSILSRRGRIASDQVVDYARQIALCLEYLHAQKLIHSKLTPDKILVTKDGTVRVTDLRLNRSKKRRWDSMKHRDAELAAYLAPEQLTGFATHKSDIYALGTVMYEMLTGRLPFPPDNIARLTRRKLEDPVESVATQVLSCPIWLDRLVLQMIDPVSRKRTHSAQAVRMALDEIVKIDATNRSAIDEISGAFNPLHVNVDKSEARELLHKSIRPKSKSSHNWLGIGMTATLLVFLIGFIVWAAWPPSSQKVIETAQALIASNDSVSLSDARTALNQLLNRNLSNEEQVLVQDLILASKRKSLLLQAAKGVQHDLQSASVQEFIQAFQMEQRLNFDEAHFAYRKLLGSDSLVASDDDHVRAECEAGLNRTEQLVGLPPGEMQLEEWLRQIAKQVTAENLVTSMNRVEALLSYLRSKSEFAALAGVAQSVHTELEEFQRTQSKAKSDGKS